MEIRNPSVEIMELTALKSFYDKKRILITGITGFKGSWLAEMLRFLGAEVFGYALGPLNAFDHFNYLNFQSTTRFGDIRNLDSLESWIESIQPELVFHLAAQPLVRDSYKNPISTYHTNVLGTLNVYEACRNVASMSSIISITTDKVYANQEWNWPYRENDKLGGYDPYSSSKACVEILTNSYRDSFLKNDIKLVTTRAGNVIGGGDWSVDRIVPDIIRSIQKKEPVIIRRPSAVRPFQHVLEPLNGYLLYAMAANNSESITNSLNFGPNPDSTVRVIDIVKSFSKFWPEFEFEIDEDISNFHEAKLLKLDISEAEDSLGWKPSLSFEETIKMTIDWYKSFEVDNKLLTNQQIGNFYALLDSKSSSSE